MNILVRNCLSDAVQSIRSFPVIFRSVFLLFLFFLCSGLLSCTGTGTLWQFAIQVTPGIEAQSCALVERYSSDRASEQYAGSLSDYGCQVSLSREIYEEKFDFCYQSGFNIYRHSPRSSVECFIQKRADDYLFLAYLSGDAGRNSQLICYFSCISKYSVTDN